ncbi:MAG: hypothetical protein HPY83_03130 [Anaerolineae bacterium]|nr:hypothetical protein [Anaerolineae bacterium]
MRSARWGLLLVLLAVLLFPKSAAAAPFIGLPFRIDDTIWGGEVAAACNPGRRVCLVVWSDSDNSLRYRFLSEDGRMLGSGSEGLSMGYGPDIAYNAASDQFLVVWAYEYTPTDTDIIAARVNGDGAGSPRVFKITGTYDQDLSPRVDAAGAQGFLVVFERSATLNQILGQRVSADGVGGDLLEGTFGIGPLTTYQWLADVAYSPAALAYAVPYHTRQEVKLQLVSTAGALLGSVQDFGEGERVSVAGDFADPSRPFLLTYLDVIGPSPPYAFAVRGYFVGPNGEPLQPSMVLSTDFTDAAPVTLILSGPVVYALFNNDAGVGQFQMPACGHAWWGKVSLTQNAVVDIKINVGGGRRDLQAALWWPEGAGRGARGHRPVPDQPVRRHGNQQHLLGERVRADGHGRDPGGQNLDRPHQGPQRQERPADGLLNGGRARLRVGYWHPHDPGALGGDMRRGGSWCPGT